MNTTKMISIEILFRGESRGGSLVIRQFRVIRGVNMVADFKKLTAISLWGRCASFPRVTHTPCPLGRPLQSAMFWGC